MKKILTSLLFLLSIATYSQTFDNTKQLESENEKIEAQLQTLKSELNLSENQYSEIKNLLIEKAEQKIAKRAELQKNREAGIRLSDEEREKLKMELFEEKQKETERYEKILTPEQMEKWRNIKKQKRENKY